MELLKREKESMIEDMNNLTETGEITGLNDFIDMYKLVLNNYRVGSTRYLNTIKRIEFLNELLTEKRNKKIEMLFV